TPQFAIVPSPAVKLQVLLPGETAVPGTVAGKTGTPANRVAGEVFTITVNAVDAGWNRNNLDNPLVGITTTDLFDTHPGNKYLTNGATTFMITFKTANSSWTITATDGGGGRFSPYATGVSAGVYVNPNTPVKLLVLLPGETDDPGSVPGSAPFGGSEGKSDWTPDNQTAGAAFTVTVKAVDSWWNINKATSPTVQITSTDGNADLSDNNKVLTNGTTTFMVTMKTANTSWKIGAKDVAVVLSSYTSPSVYINPNEPTRLRIIVPGQTRTPGTVAGKSGGPSNRTAGAQFTITVDACDDWWNTNAASAPLVAITSEDTNAVLPSAAALSGGSASFNFTFKTANTSWTITASNTNGSLISSQTAKIIVQPDTNDNWLQVLSPGEIHQPGTTSGKNSSGLLTQIAGTTFTITVNSVDRFWNICQGKNPSVHLTSSDNYAELAGDKILSNGTTTFVVMFKVANTTQTITATSSGYQSNKSAQITVNPDTNDKWLQVLVPAQIKVPGSLTGKSGAISTQTAGVTFTITVRSVDENWNLCSGNNPSINIGVSDPNGEVEAGKTLSGGLASFWIKLKTVNSTWTVTTVSGYNDYTSSQIPVKPHDAVKLQVLLPGETAASGTSDGKGGRPSTRTAGVPFAITVNCVDDDFNVNILDNPYVEITVTDPDGVPPAQRQLVNGTTTFVVTFKTANSTWTIKAEDKGGGRSAYTSNTSSQ
ncbi:MAG: hypothetical protein KKA41_17770, partial [Proteobacteria bacterium]|nr:hypothetical protein [Pseudomonadota bacterium]